MTRKDYKRIAAALSQAHTALAGNWQALAGVEVAQDRIALALKADNPRFDSGRFHDACKPETLERP